MPEKIVEVKENVIDFVDDHSDAVYIGIYCLVMTGISIGSIVAGLKMAKWQAKMIGKEVANNLK